MSISCCCFVVVVVASVVVLAAAHAAVVASVVITVVSAVAVLGVVAPGDFAVVVTATSVVVGFILNSTYRPGAPIT